MIDSARLIGVSSNQLEAIATKELKLAGFYPNGLPIPSSRKMRVKQKRQKEFERSMLRRPISVIAMLATSHLTENEEIID